VAIRVWESHPRRHLEADSSLRSSLILLEELKLLNEAVPAGRKQEMNEKLRPVGFYSDTEVGEPGQPKLAGSRGKYAGPVEPIVSYLRNAHHIAVSGIGVYDEAAPDGTFIAELSIQTDGVWFWPSSYPYYVEKYRVQVPEELLKLASSRRWLPPTFPDHADFDDRIPFGD
jgi:hypothetical protein